MAEDPELLPVASKDKNILQKKKNQKKVNRETDQSITQQDSSPSLGQTQDQINVNNITNVQIANPCKLLATEANRGIKSTIIQAQEKAQIKAKKNDEILEKIAKVVDVAMAAETSGQIKS